VILETQGWNRFDYPAFNYGSLPENQEAEVTVYQCRMREKETPSSTPGTYILDYSIWNPEYKKYKTRLKNVFSNYQNSIWHIPMTRTRSAVARFALKSKRWRHFFGECKHEEFFKDVISRHILRVVVKRVDKFFNL